MKSPILFLDLDGTVRHPPEGKKYVHGPEDVVIYDGVPELLKRYKNAGWRIAAVSNQGGVALGHVSEENMFAASHKTDKLCSGLFDVLQYCIHHPDAGIGPCLCRKPQTGMLVLVLDYLERIMAPETYPLNLALMVGDMITDEECARNAGIRFMWAEEWRKGEHKI